MFTCEYSAYLSDQGLHFASPTAMMLSPQLNDNAAAADAGLRTLGKMHKRSVAQQYAACCYIMLDTYYAPALGGHLGIARSVCLSVSLSHGTAA